MCSQVIVTSTLLLLKLIGVSLSELLPAGHPNNWLHCLLHGTRISYICKNNTRLMVLLVSILNNQDSVVCSYLLLDSYKDSVVHMHPDAV